MRKIQSFVRRAGRLTVGQKLGLDVFWVDYGIDIDTKINGNRLDYQILSPASKILLKLHLFTKNQRFSDHASLIIK